MVLRTLRRFADIRWAVLIAVLIGIYATCLDVLNDPDVWWHIKTGQWILANHRVPVTEMYSYATAPDTPWTPHAWLSEVIFATVYNAGGLLVLALLVALVTWSGFVALALRCLERGIPALAIALALLFGAKAAQPVTGTRTQMVTFALLCWVLWLAERQLVRGGRWRWAIPVLFLFWANLHAGFVAGLGALFLTLAVAAWQCRADPAEAERWGRVKGLAVVSGISVAACCINPFGPRLLAFALGSSSNNLRKLIVEWASPDFHDPSLQFLLIFIAGLVILGGLAPRRRLADVLLSGLGTGLALLAVRNAAIVVALGVPLWADGLDGAAAAARLRRRAASGEGTWRIVLGAVVAGVGVAGAAAVVGAAAADASPSGIASVYPVCAADALTHAPAGTRVFAPYFHGGYLIFRDWPQVYVYAYGESEALGDAVINRYVTIAAASSAPLTAQLLDSPRTDVVIADPAGPLAAQLDSSTQWQRTEVAGNGLRLWVRRGATWVPAGCSG